MEVHLVQIHLFKDQKVTNYNQKVTLNYNLISKQIKLTFNQTNF